VLLLLTLEHIDLFTVSPVTLDQMDGLPFQTFDPAADSEVEPSEASDGEKAELPIRPRTATQIGREQASPNAKVS